MATCCTAVLYGMGCGLGAGHKGPHKFSRPEPITLPTDVSLIEACNALMPYLEGLEDEGRSDEHRQEIKAAIENFKAAVAKYT